MTNAKVKGFFITGTGTGVGKTYVCRVLADGFSNHHAVSYMKPVQTGCVRRKNGNLLAPDFEYVKKSNALVTGEDALHVPYRFMHACSPHLATRIAHEEISLKRVNDNLQKINGLFGKGGGCVLVEGAGGVLVPIGKSLSMVHLIMHLKLPVILVTTPALGTLNHTFLTLCALQSSGAVIAGVVMNNASKSAEDYIYKDNMKTIRSFLGPVPFFELKHRTIDNKKRAEFCNELATKHL
jgi:dethiobiotin synthetase